MKKLYIILFCWTMFIGLAQAQILPPDFICVKGDSLFWDLPTNTCGPFNSYDIYGSQSQSGPFVLLATITDPAQAAYFHINPSGEQWFFYLLSNFNCPGEVAIPSDTLDNRPPVVSPIRSVTVNGSNVLVSWQPSPSPEVIGYVIYRETPIGVVPVDTVFNGTTYLDLNADPNQRAEGYLVNALDQCGNTSIFDLKHKTIFMEASVEPCERVVSLKWNPYQNWAGGVSKQELWVGENGGIPSLAHTLAASDSSFNFIVSVDSSDYCFYLQAYEAGTAETSTSNEICLTAAIVQPANVLFTENASVVSDNEVEVTWQWNTNAEINGYSILRSTDNIDFQAIDTQTPTFPLSQQNTFTDMAASPGEGKVFYQIQTTDNCGTDAFSTYAATIFLEGSSLPGNINRLEWTNLDIENATAISYDVYKRLDGPATKIATVNSPTLFHEDLFDPSNPREALACYYIIANAVLNTPSGSTLSIASQSNEICIQPPVLIYVPNAFAPEGINNEFMPLLVLGDLLHYEMHIYDRYGQELFFTDIPDAGWNGKKDGHFMPQGVYVYLIKAVQSNGRESEKRGTLLLLR